MQSNPQREAVDPVLAYVARHQQRFLDELAELLAIPSISTAPAHRTHVERCAEWLTNHLQHLGFDARVFSTPGHPIVYAQRIAAKDAPVVLLYGHYDVQPAGELRLWDSPPFQATIRNGRLYARGATDDKGQFYTHLKAAEAWRSVHGELPFTLKIFLEGEEEVGSTHLLSFMTEHKDLLACNVAVISDTPFYADGVPAICYGMRGIVYFQVDVQGPNRDLHSGSYGGCVQNPVHVLAGLLACLHDARGAVTIPGFYDDVLPLSVEERRAWAQLPQDDSALARDLGVPVLHGEEGFTTLERIWARPTLDCNGITGGFTGSGMMSIIPAHASAKLSMRLVPNQDPGRIAAQFEQHIRALAPRSAQVDVRLLSAADPFLMAVESPAVRAARVALRESFGREAVLQRDGGSIPAVTHIQKVLSADSVLLGFGLPEENAHGPNEFLKLDHFFGGIRTVVHFYHQLEACLSP